MKNCNKVKTVSKTKGPRLDEILNIHKGEHKQEDWTNLEIIF